MKKKFIIIFISIIIVLISLLMPSKGNNEDVIFRVIESDYNDETGETKLKINVRNNSNYKMDFSSFVITLYDKDMNMLVASAASICEFDQKNHCVLGPLQNKDFELIVGVDARNVAYIEYSFD